MANSVHQRYNIELLSPWSLVQYQPPPHFQSNYIPNAEPNSTRLNGLVLFCLSHVALKLCPHIPHRIRHSVIRRNEEKKLYRQPSRGLGNEMREKACQTGGLYYRKVVGQKEIELTACIIVRTLTIV